MEHARRELELLSYSLELIRKEAKCLKIKAEANNVLTPIRYALEELLDPEHNSLEYAQDVIYLTRQRLKQILSLPIYE